MTFEQTLHCLPGGWSFTHLMALEPSGYQVNLINREDRVVVIGTGDTFEQALGYAMQNTFDAKNFMHLYDPATQAAPEQPLLTSLDIAKLFLRRDPINRRL